MEGGKRHEEVRRNRRKERKRRNGRKEGGDAKNLRGVIKERDTWN